MNVIINGFPIFTSTITQIGVSRSFATNLTILAGSTVDFAVGPNGNLVRHATNTRIRRRITPFATASPLVEWNDPTNSVPARASSSGSRGLPGTNFAPGALWANLWDTNLQPHVIATAPTPSPTAAGSMSPSPTTRTAATRSFTPTASAPPPCISRPTSCRAPRATSIWVSTRPGFPTASAFAGGLDEFSVYQRALSPCEVNAIFNAGSRGKYGTNVLVCPVATEVTLLTAAGSQTYAFTNGLTWTNNGPHWETNTISFSTVDQPDGHRRPRAESLQPGRYQRAPTT